MNLLSFLIPPGDRWVLLAWFLLCLISLAVLWSVTEPIRGPYELLDPGVAKGIFFRQIFWMGVGFGALLLASRVPLRYLDNVAVPLFLFSILLLVLILLVGPRIGGARRWLVLGPIHFQPSELAKVTFILVTANILGRSTEEERGLSAALVSLLVMAVPMILILREPDLGTSLVFLAVWVGMVFWYGFPGILLLGAGSAVLSAVIMFYAEKVAAPEEEAGVEALAAAGQAITEEATKGALNEWIWGVYILLVIAVLFFMHWNIISKVVLLVVNIGFGIGIPFFWDKLQGYQQERILTFFDPTRDAFGSGYQAIQSKVAIGSGGLFGTHYLKGTQKGLAFLPERHTDFIFSVLGEELGFVGALALLGLFLLIILRGIEHAANARRPFGRFVAVGVVTYFTFHVVVNVAITTGLLPVTGLPLPLISYGGSNLVVSSLLLGLLLNVSSRTFEN